jgi:hypothetical protein
MNRAHKSEQEIASDKGSAKHSTRHLMTAAEANLLGLQRTAGNQAVSALINDLGSESMVGMDGAPSVQRRAATATRPKPIAPPRFRCPALDDGRVPGGTFVDDIDTRAFKELRNPKYWPWEIPTTWHGWSDLSDMSNPSFWNGTQLVDATNGTGINQPLAPYPGTFEDVDVSISIEARVASVRYVPVEDAPKVGGGSSTKVGAERSSGREEKTTADAKLGVEIGNEKTKGKAGADISGGHESSSKVERGASRDIEVSQELEKQSTHVFEVELEWTATIRQYIKTGFWTTIGTIGITNLVNWIRQNEQQTITGKGTARLAVPASKCEPE